VFFICSALGLTYDDGSTEELGLINDDGLNDELGLTDIDGAKDGVVVLVGCSAFGLTDDDGSFLQWRFACLGTIWFSRMQQKDRNSC
jgi:hypothetical protein